MLVSKSISKFEIKIVHIINLDSYIPGHTKNFKYSSG